MSLQTKVTRALASVDVFPKPVEDLPIEQTQTGAAVSIISIVVIVLLVGGELWRYARVHIREHIEVDTNYASSSSWSGGGSGSGSGSSPSSSHLSINFNITFHKLRCSQCRLDVMDVSGDQQVNVMHSINKLRIDGTNGQPIGKPVLENRSGLGMFCCSAAVLLELVLVLVLELLVVVVVLCCCHVFYVLFVVVVCCRLIDRA